MSYIQSRAQTPLTREESLVTLAWILANFEWNHKMVIIGIMQLRKKFHVFWCEFCDAWPSSQNYCWVYAVYLQCLWRSFLNTHTLLVVSHTLLMQDSKSCRRTPKHHWTACRWYWWLWWLWCGMRVRWTEVHSSHSGNTLSCKVPTPYTHMPPHNSGMGTRMENTGMGHN